MLTLFKIILTLHINTMSQFNQVLSSKPNRRQERLAIIAISLGAILGYFSRAMLVSLDNTNAFINIIAINAIGAFIFAAISQFNNKLPKLVKLFLLTGFCSSFTTYSLTVGQSITALYSQSLVLFFEIMLGNFFLCFLFSLSACLIFGGIKRIITKASKKQKEAI